jgi:hypothetical protein
MEYLISKEFKVNNRRYKDVTKKLITKSEPVIGNDNRFHYVYKVLVPHTNWEYIGVRTNDNWESDDYLGSSYYDTYQDDINKSKEVVFEILSFHEGRESAENEEIRLVTKEYIKQEGVYNKRVPNMNFNTINCVTVIDKEGNTMSVKADDPRYLSKELVGVTKGKTMYIDKEGNKFQVSVDDTRIKTGELVGVNKGRTHTQESKDKMSIVQTGKKLSQEHKDKIRIASLNMSQEHKDKIGAASKSRTHTQESKDKISAVHTGKKLSQETKDKMSESRTGKKHSQETKDKISATKTGKKRGSR